MVCPFSSAEEKGLSTESDWILAKLDSHNKQVLFLSALDLSSWVRIAIWKHVVDDCAAIKRQILGWQSHILIINLFGDPCFNAWIGPLSHKNQYYLCCGCTLKVNGDCLFVESWDGFNWRLANMQILRHVWIGIGNKTTTYFAKTGQIEFDLFRKWWSHPKLHPPLYLYAGWAENHVPANVCMNRFADHSRFYVLMFIFIYAFSAKELRTLRVSENTFHVEDQGGSTFILRLSTMGIWKGHVLMVSTWVPHMNCCGNESDRLDSSWRRPPEWESSVHSLSLALLHTPVCWCRVRKQ